MLDTKELWIAAAFTCALVLGGGCHGSSGGGPAPPANVPSDTPPPTQTPIAGLDQRPSNLTCVAPATGSSNAGATIQLERVFENLRFDQPLAMLQAPADDSRWFVLEKTGRVRVFATTPNVSSFDSDFIQLPVNASSEGGLLGMAFHPQYATNGQVFLSWTEQTPMVSVVGRFTVTNGGAILLSNSRQDVVRVNQPNTNHNGGQIAFGPDGYLYLGLGDGGGGGDPDNTAQDTRDLLGSFLRIDVDGAVPYAIPPDNPFAGNVRCGPSHLTSADQCPEIFAWGFRNPWRWSFDTATGTLWAGDVGQGALEEVDQVRLGGNYGWDCREGTSVYSSPAPSCSTTPTASFVPPVHEYGRTQGTSITGGYVYRGAALPALAGKYVFGDYGSGRIWRLDDDGSGGFTARELLDTPLAIASFGRDTHGELYVIDIAGGTLHKMVDGGSAAPANPAPTLLSATGCVRPQDATTAASGMIPYDVAAPFWSDGAAKERWLAIPDGTTIGLDDDGDFEFPNGTVLMQHFRLNGELVETRLFMRHPDGEWAGYSYEWNTQRTDATLVQGGKTAVVGQQSWIFPGGNDCLRCHTSAAGFALGLEAAQLNHDFTYASTGRTANQLHTLNHITLFASPIGDPMSRPELPNPDDFDVPLSDAARAYLHTNCAGCHRPGGVAQSSMDLRFSTPLNATAACDVAPQFGDLGLTNARIIAPGAPGSSVLLARMDRRDGQAMPPLASNVIDAAGRSLVRDWIASSSTCQ